jgi:hypothetical protein
MKTLFLSLLLLVLAAVAPGCTSYTVLSPAEIAARGTHRYAHTNRDRATEACAAALATLGYRVTVKQLESGVVRTAPASVMTSATGGRGYANITEDGLAWSIVVSAAGDDVIVRATPRGFRNGSEMKEEGIWVAEVMDAKFRDLWSELDAALGVRPA